MRKTKLQLEKEIKTHTPHTIITYLAIAEAEADSVFLLTLSLPQLSQLTTCCLRHPPSEQELTTASGATAESDRRTNERDLERNALSLSQA